MSEKRSNRGPLSGLRRDLRKRSEKQVQQFMSKMMSDPDMMKAAGNAMTLMSRVNEARSKGFKPLDDLVKDVDRQIARLQKKAESMSARLDELEKKLAGESAS